jgi:hypothetical protein
MSVAISENWQYAGPHPAMQSKHTIRFGITNRGLTVGQALGAINHVAKTTNTSALGLTSMASIDAHTHSTEGTMVAKTKATVSNWSSSICLIGCKTVIRYVLFTYI